MPGVHEVTDRVPLHHGDRARAGGEASPAARLCLRHRHTPGPQADDASGIESVPDRFRGIAQVRVTRVAQRLGDQRDDFPFHTRAGERVLERLLDHVAHPARGRRHEHAERQRLDPVAREFVAGQLVAHLWTVAVHEHDAPPGARQLDDRREALARVAELVADRRALACGRHGVAAERHDNRFRTHGGRT